MKPHYIADLVFVGTMGSIQLFATMVALWCSAYPPAFFLGATSSATWTIFVCIWDEARKDRTP